MLSWVLFSNHISIFVPPNNYFRPATVRVWFKHQAFLGHSSASEVQSVAFRNQSKSSVHQDSLRVLEWDKLCDCVSSFARTALGREATKAQLWSLNQTYEESLRLLDETNAAVEMQKHGGCSLDFSGINVLLVQAAIHHVRRSLPMDGNEAMALAMFA